MNPADVLLSSADGGDVRVNIGEQSDGDGFGADTPVYGADGFVAVPNPPSNAGAAQAIVTQDGNVQRVIAMRDTRFAGQAGALAPGDRAVVSDSAAYLKLTKGSNRIEIVSGAMRVTLDGDTGVVTIDGASEVKVGPSSTIVTLGSGADNPIDPTGRFVRYGDQITVPVVGSSAMGPLSRSPLFVPAPVGPGVAKVRG